LTALVVDANVHVIPTSEERARYPFSDVGGAAEAFTEDQTNSGEMFVALMDEAGVDRAFVINSRFFGFDNTYCAEAVRARPERFVGIANVDVFDPAAPAQVERWIDEEGLHGIRVWGGHMYNDRRGCATWVSDTAYDPLWRAIAERGVPCNAHKTFPEALDATRSLLDRVDGLKLTLNNLAHVPLEQGPESADARALLALAEFPTAYVSFSVDFAAAAGRPGTPERALLEALLDAFGAGRLMWSAFYPSLQARSYPESVALLRESLASLDDEDRAGILGGAAASLYPVLAA
jgi:L-fuconolactonase